MEKLQNLKSWKQLTNPSLTKTELVSNIELSKHLQAIGCCGIKYNPALQNISEQKFKLLMQIASDLNLPEAISDYFKGSPVNFTENRAALHTALRAPYARNKLLLNTDIANEIQYALKIMSEIAHKVRSKKWLGSTGKPIRNIVNVGIGGSDFGPKMGLNALKDFRNEEFNYYFISDADPNSFIDVTSNISPEETLFIVVSKSFKTKETLLNAEKVKHWLKIQVDDYDKHFIAVTANERNAKEMGFTNIVPTWEWVGGRFSFCSAVNLILMIAIGETNFKKLLDGAYSMDQHFAETELAVNMPVLMALFGIYNVNVRDIKGHVTLVYTNRLQYLPGFLQQLEMESNGKSINRWGEKVLYNTCPIIWGGVGNQAQHSYYQFLAQGTAPVALDFIFDASRKDELVDRYGQNKINILCKGKSSNDWAHIEGKQPISSLILDKISPYTIGSLIALYEHKVFVQSVIWQINAFDQFGVESAKEIAHNPPYKFCNQVNI